MIRSTGEALSWSADGGWWTLLKVKMWFLCHHWQLPVTSSHHSAQYLLHLVHHHPHHHHHHLHHDHHPTSDFKISFYWHFWFVKEKFHECLISLIFYKFYKLDCLIVTINHLKPTHSFPSSSRSQSLIYHLSTCPTSLIIFTFTRIKCPVFSRSLPQANVFS